MLAKHIVEGSFPLVTIVTIGNGMMVRELYSSLIIPLSVSFTNFT
jgi:hypothetical protein